MRRTYLVAYDIGDPGRWRTIYRVMMGNGDPLQLSLFVCRLSVTERKLLELKVRDLIVPSEDSVMFVDVGLENRPVDEWFTMIGKSRLGISSPPRWFVV